MFELNHALQDFIGRKMSDEQAKAITCLYTMMKEMLLKYDT